MSSVPQVSIAKESSIQQNAYTLNSQLLHAVNVHVHVCTDMHVWSCSLLLEYLQTILLNKHVEISMSIRYPDATTVSVLSDTMIREGSTITITCEAFGYPPPTVVWNGALSNRVSVSDGFALLTGYGNVTRVSVNLTITNASREDTGVYMCSANNSVGTDSSNISITVQCKNIHRSSNYIANVRWKCIKFNREISS